MTNNVNNKYDKSGISVSWHGNLTIQIVDPKMWRNVPVNVDIKNWINVVFTRNKLSVILFENVQISDQPDKTPIHGGKQWQSD